MYIASVMRSVCTVVVLYASALFRAFRLIRGSCLQDNHGIHDEHGEETDSEKQRSVIAPGSNISSTA
jgi:hypothetical protein